MGLFQRTFVTLILVYVSAISFTSCSNTMRLINNSIPDFSLVIEAYHGSTVSLLPKLAEILPNDAILSSTLFDPPSAGQIVAFNGDTLYVTPALGTGDTIDYRVKFQDGGLGRGKIHIIFSDAGYVADLIVPAGQYTFFDITNILLGASDTNFDGKIAVQFLDGVVATRSNGEFSISVPQVPGKEFVLFAAPGDVALFKNAQQGFIFHESSVIYAEGVDNLSVVGLHLTVDPTPSGPNWIMRGGAIYLSNSNANYISDNTIIINAGNTDMHGIYVHLNSHVANISHNNVTVTSNSHVPSSAIYFHASSSGTHLANNNIDVSGSANHGVYVALGGQLQFHIENHISIHGAGGSALRFLGDTAIGIISDLTATVDGSNAAAVYLADNTTIAAFRNSTITVNGTNSKGMQLYPGTTRPSGLREMTDVEFQLGSAAAAIGVFMSPLTGTNTYSMDPTNFTALRFCELPGAAPWTPYLDATATSYFTGADLILGGACNH